MRRTRAQCFVIPPCFACPSRVRASQGPVFEDPCALPGAPAQAPEPVIRNDGPGGSHQPLPLCEVCHRPTMNPSSPKDIFVAVGNFIARAPNPVKHAAQGVQGPPCRGYGGAPHSFPLLMKSKSTHAWIWTSLSEA